MSQFQPPVDVLTRISSLEKKRRRGNYDVAYDPADRPGAPTGVDLDFRVREKRDRIHYTGVVKWNPISAGICAADVSHYEIQFEPCFLNGNAREAGRRYREIVIIEDPDEAEAEFLKCLFPTVEHPKEWYYHARVAVIDKENRKSPWSAWTSPISPQQDGDPSPPYPNGIALGFDKNEGRSEPRWRAIVEFDEIPFWDVPPTADRDKFEADIDQTGGITAAATSVKLTDVSGLPAPLSLKRSDEVILTIRPNSDEREVIAYSTKDGPNNTIGSLRRGLEGTAKRAHPNGAKVKLSAADAQQQQNDLKTYQIRLRRRLKDDSGWATNAAGKFIQRRQTIRWETEDEDNDSKVRAFFDNVRKQHYWKASVRTRDRFNRWGEWSDWTPIGSPSDTSVVPAPTALVVDVDPRKINLLWDAPFDADDDETDDDLKTLTADIAYFQVQVSDRSDFNKTLSNFWRSDRYVGVMHKSFKKKKTDRGTFHIRVRSVNGSGKKSAWTTGSNSRKKPGKVRNRTVAGRTRAVVVKFDPPNTWDDLTTDGWDATEVAHYEVSVYRNGSFYDQDLQVKSLRKSFPIPKADANGNWSAIVNAVGHEGESTTPDAATGSAVPEAAGAETFSELGGTLLSGHLPAIIDASKFVTGVRPHHYGANPPANPIDGDVWFDSNVGKVKKYYSSARTFYNNTTGTYQSTGTGWIVAADGNDVFAGSVVADVIRGSYIYGLVIEAGSFTGGAITLTGSGSIFRTGPSNVDGWRIEISNTSAERLSWIQRSLNADALRASISIYSGNYLNLFANNGIRVEKSILVDATGGNPAVQVGTYNDQKNVLRLRNTGAALPAPPTGYCDIHFRGDLTPSELRVIFPNGSAKVLATA